MGHGWLGALRGARRAVAVAAAAGAALYVLAPGASHAATTAPTLTVSAARADVKVAWKYASDSSRDKTELEIQRGPDANHFSVWLTAVRPRTSAWRMDRNPLSGANVYRARVIVNGVAGPWGATVSINASSGSTGGGTGGGGGTGKCTNARADILWLVNQARSATGAGPLQENARLDQAAQVHTQMMADTHTLTHDGWATEIRGAGYTGGMLGQNIAYGYQSAAAVMDGWMHSAGHKANILSPSYRDIGIGCVDAGTVWWTQDFGGG